MQIAIGLFPGFTALDVVGPYQVLAETPGTDVILCAVQSGPIGDDKGRLHLAVEHTFEDVPSPDVLIIPGGPGRVGAEATRPGGIVDWIRKAHATTTYTTSVCTGALLLGEAGLLDGRAATTHWAYYDQLRAFGAEPTEQRVVDSGDRILTAAGVSSGIDMAFHLAARLFGEEVAQAVQLGIEYDPQPPFDHGAPSKANAVLRDLVRSATLGAEQAWQRGGALDGPGRGSYG